MRNDLKNQKGITLIVLVITIIVMIIIAAISINYGLDSVETAKDSVVESNLQMVQQKIAEEYIKNDMNGTQKEFYGQALSYDDVQAIKGSETIALQKLTNRTEYDKGTPYYRLSAETLKNIGVEVPDGQEYLVDYDQGEIWDITNIKYEDGETYIYLGPINSLDDDTENNVDSPITISLEEDLQLVDDKYVLKIRVKDVNTKIASNSWNTEDFSLRRTIIRNAHGAEVSVESLAAFVQSEVTSSTDTEGEYIYTIKFAKSAFHSFSDDQELTITIKRNSIIDYNGDTNSTTVLSTVFVAEPEPGTITWDLGNKLYSTKNPKCANGYTDLSTGEVWGTEATVEITVYASTGLQYIPYIFEYYWSPDGTAPTNFDAVASEIMLRPTESESESVQRRVTSTIYLNSGTGKGKLYVKPKESYTGINTPPIEMGYKTVDINLDNTPPTTEEHELEGIDFWGLYNQRYFKPNFQTIILTDEIYTLRIIDNESGIRRMGRDNNLWTMDGINKLDFDSDILKNDDKLLEFFAKDFREGGGAIGLLNQQLDEHKNYVDIGACFLYGDRASDYYYIYRLESYERDGETNPVLSDNVGNEISMPIKQGPFNIDGNQPDINTVSVDQNSVVGKIIMIDDYSGVASGKASDVQKNIDNLKNIKYRWVPEGDDMLRDDIRSIVSDYRRDPEKQARELTPVNTTSSYVSYSQENDFDNYKYVTITVDPPTVPGKYYLFVYAADFEDVAGNILLDYFTVNDNGGFASGAYTSEGANRADDAARFSDNYLVIESDATDIQVDVVEQNNVGFPTSFDINVRSRTNGKFDIKKMYIERAMSSSEDGIYEYNSQDNKYIKTESILNSDVAVRGSYTQTCYSTMNGPITVCVEDKYGNLYSGTFTLQHAQETIWEMSVQAGKRYKLPKGEKRYYRYVQIGNNPGMYQKADEYAFIAPRTEKIKVRFSGANAIVGFDESSTYFNILEGEILDTALAITKVERFGIHSPITAEGLGSNKMAGMYEGCKNLTELPSLDGENLIINQNAFACVGNAKSSSNLNDLFRGTAISSFDSRFLGKTCYINNFAETFEDCKNLTSVSGDLFAHCTLALAKEKVSYCATFKNSGLESIPENLFSNSASKRADRFLETFYGTKITAIPGNLFSNCENAETFEGTFRECNNLTTVPSNLFLKNTQNKNFTHTFEKCEKLTSIPEMLFTNNGEATDFDYTFSETALESIPEKLFENNVNAEDFTCTFFSTEITSIPEKLFEKNIQATDFRKCFADTNLYEIPVNLFVKNTKAEFFIATFERTKITSIPEALFVKNVNAINFAYTFGSNAITSIPEKLFEKNIVAKYFNNTFEYTKILSVPEKLFFTNVEATSFSGVFKGCGDLVNTSSNQNVPYNLFYQNAKVTDFGAVFMDDGQVQWIPENFFAGQKNKGYNISFGSTFRGTGLKTIPKELFWYLKPSSFNFTFGYSGVTELKEEIFAKTDLSELTDISWMFWDDDCLVNVSGNVFKNAKKLTDANRTFSRCDNLTKMEATIFVGCESLKSIGAMFYNCPNLTSVTESLFIYKSGTYCPIETVALHDHSGNPNYGNAGQPHSDKEFFASTDGVFEKCPKLTKCPDLWNRGKYPQIEIKTEVKKYCRWNGILLEEHIGYINYAAFYQVNSVIRNKISDSDLRNKWCDMDCNIYINYAD